MKNRTNKKHKSGFYRESGLVNQFISIISVRRAGQGINYNKRGLRASGLSLLPLALRPLLLLPVLLSIFSFQTANVSAKSVTLTIPSEPLSLKVTPGQGSTFRKSSAGTISVATDSSYGYSLSIQSKTSNDLLNGSNKIASIVSALSESDYENNGDSNTWAYMPSKLGGSVNTDFQPGPTTEPTTLDRVEESSTGTDYGLTLAAKIDSTLPAGNYSNNFYLTVTSNEPPNDGIMQNWTGCDDLAENTSLDLLDKRDSKIYSVAKLKDGNCWMTKNLAIGENGTEIELTPEDSDIASNFVLPANNTDGFANIDRPRAYINNTYGGYYNWFAATAGEGIGVGKFYGSVEHSICPKGWRLPTKKEIDRLITAYDGDGSSGRTALQDSPIPNFQFGGYYFNGGPGGGSTPPNSVDYNGYYWSSTADDDSIAYYLYLYYKGQEASSQSGGNKAYGSSVRCVSRSNDLTDIGTMQTVQNWKDNIKTEQIVRAKDNRDDEYYRISRLKDGRIWMIDSLEIAGKTITNENSDTAVNFTLPKAAGTSFQTYSSSDVILDDNGSYYTWYAATAAEGTKERTSDDTLHSICPKGWKLPSQTEFNALLEAYGGNNAAGANAMQGYPSPNFRLDGQYYAKGTWNSLGYTSYSPDLTGKGQVGYYWSSTAGGSSSGGNPSYFAYQLFLTNNEISTTNTPQIYGNQIRCIAYDENQIDVGTMQNVQEWKDNIKENQTVIAKDTRNDRNYKVSKLKDGNLWMTENLSIDGKNLTSEDSDVASTYNLPPSSIYGFTNTQYPSVYIDTSYGGYYNWIAATAGEGTDSIDNGDIEHSICPRGWRLPTQKDFDSLITILGGNNNTTIQTLRNTPYNFLYAGIASYSTSYNKFILDSTGSVGQYWTSTSKYAGGAYILHFNKAYNGVLSINSTDSGSNASGLPIRCIAR